MDALSAVLRMVRLRACIYFVRDMPAPWGLDIPAQMTGPFHMVLAGRCLMEREGEAVWLEAGDAAIFPHGNPHCLRDRPDSPAQPAAQVMPALLSGSGPATGPAATRMLCGHFEIDRRFDHPVLRELPPSLIVRNVFDARHAPGLGQIVSLLSQEAEMSGPGAAVIADRMGEVLFVLALRSWLADQAPREGLLAAMADVRLSRALDHIHGHAGQEIDLETLARIAGMSRTAFALRFRDVTGTTPAAYLTEWRLMQARELLAGSDLPMAEIADRVGYKSDASFLRAFRRIFGDSPGAFRRRIRDAVPAGE